MRDIFEDPSIFKIGHNLKYDWHVFSRPSNSELSDPVDDTVCLSYVLDTGLVDRHSLDYLASHWLDHKTIKYDEVCGRVPSKFLLRWYLQN